MLSVRNLAKIKRKAAQRLLMPPVDGVSIAAMENGGTLVGDSSSPDGAHDAGAGGLGAGEASPAQGAFQQQQQQQQQQLRFTLPTIVEMRELLTEYIDEARRLGVDAFLMLLGLLILAGYVLRQMLLYLEAEVGLALPSGSSVANAVFDFADAHPLLFLLLDFVVAVVIGAVVFYLAELTEFWQRAAADVRVLWKRLSAGVAATAAATSSTPVHDPAAGFYTPLKEADDGGGSAPKFSGAHPSTEGVHASSSAKVLTTPVGVESAASHAEQGEAVRASSGLQATQGGGTHGPASTPDGPEGLSTRTAGELSRELVAVVDSIEELEVTCKLLHRKTTTPKALQARAELKALQMRRDQLRAMRAELLHEAPAQPPNAQDSERARKPVRTEPSLVGRVLRGPLMQIVSRSANGIFSVTVRGSAQSATRAKCHVHAMPVSCACHARAMRVLCATQAIRHAPCANSHAPHCRVPHATHHALRTGLLHGTYFHFPCFVSRGLLLPLQSSLP